MIPAKKFIPMSSRISGRILEPALLITVPGLKKSRYREKGHPGTWIRKSNYFFRFSAILS